MAWKIINRPAGCKVVGSKWVFRVKYTPTGQINKFKTWLIAQGFSQVPGIDFDEVFSLTLKLDSLHIMLVIAAIEDLEVHQLDVVNVYINGKLEKMIYIEPPETLDLRPD